MENAHILSLHVCLFSETYITVQKCSKHEYLFSARISVMQSQIKLVFYVFLCLEPGRVSVSYELYYCIVAE